MTAPTLDLDKLHLESGNHSGRSRGGKPTVCLMEAVAWAAGEDHSDMPDCVSPVLRNFGVRLNDTLPDDQRQQLKRFIPDLIGTRHDGHDDARTALAKRWLMTEALPAWLELGGMDDLAEKARESAELSGAELLTSLRTIRELTWAARRDRIDGLREKIAAQIREKRAAVAAEAAGAAEAAVAAEAAGAAVAAVAAEAGRPLTPEEYNRIYWAVRDAVRKHIWQWIDDPANETFEKIRALRDQQRLAAIDLYDRMIHVGRDAA
jgi:hypothetical protein